MHRAREHGGMPPARTTTSPESPATTPAGTGGGPASRFRHMDESTAEQWSVIGAETLANQPRVAEQILTMLRQLEAITDGFAVDQLQHALQTAWLAEQAGASDEMIVAALCHDIGKLISVANHPRIAAEILWPYVSDETYHVVHAHQDFQGRHYYHHFGGNPNERDQYRDAPWFDAAARFADEWDQVAFDPAVQPPPLEHFEPLVRAQFAAPQRM